MELFYAHETDGRSCRLDPEESAHAVRVLRYRAGDEIHVMDGSGTLYRCRLRDDSPKGAEAEVLETFPSWGAHPYMLTLGCCPTKNNERFEWMVEKAVEIGVDTIVPLIGAHSERKVYKTQRAERIALSAAKQSLKAALPRIVEPVSVEAFLSEPRQGLKLIACCFDAQEQRRSIREVLCASAERDITVLIGPEGDFSLQEAEMALAAGYLPVHLGASRLRTETAGITAVEAVYFRFMES